MTGFISKLFNRKPKAASEEAQPQKSQAKAAKKEKVVQKAEQVRPSKPPKPQKPEVYYFLDADDARTFGNVEYMRSSKSIRRTFPKSKLGKDNESIRQVSATEMQRFGSVNGVVPPAASNGSTAQSAADSTSKISERRRADSSLDQFRTMAREIRKG